MDVHRTELKWRGRGSAKHIQTRCEFAPHATANCRAVQHRQSGSRIAWRFAMPDYGYAVFFPHPALTTCTRSARAAQLTLRTAAAHSSCHGSRSTDSEANEQRLNTSSSKKPGHENLPWPPWPYFSL